MTDRFHPALVNTAERAEFEAHCVKVQACALEILDNLDRLGETTACPDCGSGTLWLARPNEELRSKEGTPALQCVICTECEVLLMVQFPYRGEFFNLRLVARPLDELDG